MGLLASLLRGLVIVCSSGYVQFLIKKDCGATSKESRGQSDRHLCDISHVKYPKMWLYGSILIVKDVHVLFAL